MQRSECSHHLLSSVQADPFGLDEFLSEAKRGKALDGIGEGSGGMGASAGGSMDAGGSGRSSLQFRKGGA